ncbi:MAG: sulfotransferase [Caldilineales bacterium]
MTYRVVSIHGVPRSGTSWLGQIFDSHPDVAYRHQPLFAYRFKDRLTLQSTAADVRRFLDELYAVSDDEFILDINRRTAASQFWQSAVKTDTSGHLVMKMVRYHHLLPLFFETIDSVKIIGIVRHPCAVINSWLTAPKEFRPGWDAQEEWRLAPKKNAGRIEEFNGFEKWKEVARKFLRFEQAYPDSFSIVQYERLVSAPEDEAARLFSFAGLAMQQQTLDFIRYSHSKNDPDPYAVVKDPGSYRRWETTLDPTIASEIIRETQGTELERFLA